MLNRRSERLHVRCRSVRQQLTISDGLLNELVTSTSAPVVSGNALAWTRFLVGSSAFHPLTASLDVLDEEGSSSRST